ncbi:MAG: DNA polymerase III subunit delta', partial [Vicinamibacteria bacterium]
MPLPFSGIVGQSDAIERIRRAIAHDRLPAAFLLCGPEGTGKRSAALALAARLLCESAGEFDACGRCGACRRIEASTHPDLHLLVPDGETLRIEPMRELLAALRLRAYEGGWKIALIDGAEKMNASAANAFLKTLEEPGLRTLFLLVAVNESLLPPTLASRCQKLRFAPLAEEVVVSLLTE